VSQVICLLNAHEPGNGQAHSRHEKVAGARGGCGSVRRRRATARVVFRLGVKEIR